MENSWGHILIVVATIESLAEIILGLRDDKGVWNRKLAIALSVGIVVSLLIPDFDAYRAIGISVFPPVAGRILTGILASRGAKMFHDFLGIVETYKNNLKNNVAAK